VAHVDVLARLAAGERGPGPAARLDGVVVELDSPMRRHGISWDDLDLLRDLVRFVPFEGVALHLPLTGERLGVALHAVTRLRTAGIPVPALWVSHLDAGELARLRWAAGVPVRLRVGTRLWLGAPETLRARADVVDTHQVRRGTAFGYRGRRSGRRGHVVVVSGGTSHGIGLRAPATGRALPDRVRAAAVAALAAAGLAPSPFRWGGRRLAFAEAPHMQVSMLFVPGDRPPPRQGDVLDLAAAMTLTTFDQVTLLDDEPVARPLPRARAA
jgi:hypothetical protein